MAAKEHVRATTRQRRARLVGTERKSLIDASLLTHLLPHLPSSGLVAAYSPMPTEPGGAALLPGLTDAGYDVLLPIALGGGQLRWARYIPGELTTGAHFGIAEPTGEQFDSTVLQDCGALVLPALGVDRTGTRLGQGAGYYDRALTAAPGVRRIALVYDNEVHDHLPAEPHDQPVHAAATPSRFWNFSG